MFIILIIGIGGEVFAQLDHVLWSSVRLRIIPDEKNAFDFRPIVRHHDNFSDYRNTSIDFVYRRKLSSQLTFGFLSRTWFLEGGDIRQFLWSSITTRKKIGPQIYEARLLAHWAIDIQDNMDNDYLRLLTAINRPLSKKLTGRLVLEPWFQFNNINRVSRMRYEIALGYKISDHYSALVLYRRQNDDKEIPSFNNWMITLTYLL